MSTKASIIYNDKLGLHFYIELLDNTVHVEIERNGLSVDLTLCTYDEWVAEWLPRFGKPHA